MTLVRPSQEMESLIRKELNENVDTRDSDLQHIKKWLKQEPHLPDTWDDGRLMTFLRGSDFSLEICKKKLDMYFTMRNAAPEFFSNRSLDRPEVQETLKVFQCPPLPGLTATGRRICMIRGAKRDDNITPNIAALIKVGLMIGDIRLAEELCGVAGDIYVIDTSQLLTVHTSLLTPAVIKKFLICIEDTYPVKIKEIHVINVIPIVEKVFVWMKPLLKEKMRNRIFFHSNMDSLYKYVPQELLPIEYGGNAESLDDIHEAWIKKLKTYAEWFKEQETVKADESRRPGKPKTYDDLFGMEGSFRQLKID